MLGEASPCSVIVAYGLLPFQFLNEIICTSIYVRIARLFKRERVKINVTKSRHVFNKQ